MWMSLTQHRTNVCYTCLLIIDIYLFNFWAKALCPVAIFANFGVWSDVTEVRRKGAGFQQQMKGIYECWMINYPLKKCELLWKLCWLWLCLCWKWLLNVNLLMLSWAWVKISWWHGWWSTSFRILSMFMRTQRTNPRPLVPVWIKQERNK